MIIMIIMIMIMIIIIIIIIINFVIVDCFCRWIQACINEELPPTTELEEGLRNGVYLAKLGHFFAPQVVSLKRIYDREQTRFKVRS